MEVEPSTDQAEAGHTEETKNLPEDGEPPFLVVIFLKKVEQKWERQANLDGLVEEAIRNETSLFNPVSFCENPKLPSENNIPRWIFLPNDKLFYTNGRLVFDTFDFPENSVMGELRNNKSNPEVEGQLN